MEEYCEQDLTEEIQLSGLISITKCTTPAKNTQSFSITYPVTNPLPLPPGPLPHSSNIENDCYKTETSIEHTKTSLSRKDSSILNLTHFLSFE